MTLGLAGLFGLSGLFGDDEVDRARKRVDGVPVVSAEDLAEGVAAVEGTVRRHRQSVEPPLEDGEVVASLEADDDREVVDRARLNSVEDREVLADQAAEEAPGEHAGDPANVRETAGGDATDAPIEGADGDSTTDPATGGPDSDTDAAGDTDSDGPAADGSDGGATGSGDGAPEGAGSSGDRTEATGADPGDQTEERDRPDDAGTREEDGDAREDGDADDPPPVVARYRRLRRDGADRIADADVVEDRFEAVPFVLEDDTGSVLVDPRDAVDADSLLVSAGNTDRYFGDEAGGRLAELRTDDLGNFEGLAEARVALGESPEWIHLRSTLRPGDRAYVLGPVTDTPGGSPPYAVAPDEDDPFLLSDMGRSALLEQLTRQTSPVDRRALLFVVLGLALVVAAVLVVGVAVDWVV